MMSDGPGVFTGVSWLSITTAHIQPSITISNLITIKPDGTLIYHEGYTPDAAAKAFWDAMGLERKQRA